VRDYALRSFPAASVAFADFHCALACIATGDHARLAQILAAIGDKIATDSYPPGPVVPSLLNGFEAYEARNWAAAIAALESALGEAVRIGGSRAQRDIVELTLIAAYLRDGRADQARALIARRGDRHPAIAVAGMT
jgi:hypothetical protein